MSNYITWKPDNIMPLHIPITTNVVSVLFYLWIIKQGSKFYSTRALSSDWYCRSLFPHTHPGGKTFLSEEPYITYQP